MTVIFDIDNTLSLSNKRFELATKPNGKIDWDIAHTPEYVLQDLPNLPVVDLAIKYKKEGAKIIIITGRPDTIKNVTEEWLKQWGVTYDELYMRTKQDFYVKAPILKRKIYETYITDDIFCAYDDDQDIIDMWIDLGIPCCKVYAIHR